jgi:sugar/nucleoside kinase (ribokinase family)
MARTAEPASGSGARTLDLLVVGDANPDLILHGGDIEPRFGQHERIVSHAALVLGGSGAITAVGAARLGLRTAMAAAVGNDVMGRFMLEQLAAAGVDTAPVRVLDDLPTGISVALSRPDDRAVLTARGALEALDPTTVADAVLRSARHVHIASPFLQPGLRDGLADLIGRAHAAGATVSLDTGWDPAERWTPVAADLSTVDVLLPNAQEVTRLAAAAMPAQERRSPAGSPASQPDVLPVDSAAALLAARGPLVVVKLGAEGALAVRGQEAARVAACRVETVDATGAGDSFDAGFLAAWLDGADLASCLALGCACGALSTRSAGGTQGQPSRAEAEEMAATVMAATP